MPGLGRIFACVSSRSFVPPRSLERRYPSLPKHQLVAVIVVVATTAGITAAIMVGITVAGTGAAIMVAGTAVIMAAGTVAAGTVAAGTVAAADAIGFRDPMVGNGAAGKRWNAPYPTL